MRVWAAGAAFALVFGLMAVPGAAAQETDKIVYFTDADGPTGGASVNCLDEHGYLATDAPAEEGKAYLSATSSGLGCTTYFTYTSTVTGTLTDDVVLDLVIGCDAVSVIGSSPATTTFRIFLLHNGEEIQQTDMAGGGFTPCALDEHAFSVPIGGQGIALAPGDTLTFEVIWWGVDAVPGQTVTYAKVDAEGASSVTLPLAMELADDSLAVYDVLTGAAPEIAIAFENETTGAYTYNWTQDLTDVDLFAEGSIANGTANVAIVDGANETLYDGTLAELLGDAGQADADDNASDGNATAGDDDVSGGNGTAGQNGTDDGNGTTPPVPALTFGNATAGDWTIAIQLDAFVGELGMRLAEHVEAEVVQAGSDDDPTTGNETLDGALDEESPGLAAAFVGLALLAVALARRRH